MALRIVDHTYAQVRDVLLECRDRLPGPICRKPVCHDHFHLGARIGLLAESLQKQTYGRLLVIAGNNDGHFWQHGTNNKRSSPVDRRSTPQSSSLDALRITMIMRNS